MFTVAVFLLGLVAGRAAQPNRKLTINDCSILLDPLFSCAARATERRPQTQSCCSMTSLFVQAGCFCDHCTDALGQVDVGLQSVVMQDLGLNNLMQACWLEDHGIYAAPVQDLPAYFMSASVKMPDKHSTPGDQAMVDSNQSIDMIDGTDGSESEQDKAVSAYWKDVMGSLYRLQDFLTVPFQTPTGSASVGHDLSAMPTRTSAGQQSVLRQHMQQALDLSSAQWIPFDAAGQVSVRHEMAAGNVARGASNVERRYFQTVKEQVVQQIMSQTEAIRSKAQSALHAQSVQVVPGEQELPGEVANTDTHAYLRELNDAQVAESLDDSNSAILSAGSWPLHANVQSGDETATESGSQELHRPVLAQRRRQQHYIFEAGDDDWDGMDTPSIVSSDRISSAVALPEKPWHFEDYMWTWLESPWEEQVRMFDDDVAEDAGNELELKDEGMVFHRRMGSIRIPVSLRSRAASFVSKHYWSLLIALSTFNLVGFAIMLVRLCYLERKCRGVEEREAYRENAVQVQNPVPGAEQLQSFITDVAVTLGQQDVPMADNRVPLLANDFGKQ